MPSFLYNSKVRAVSDHCNLMLQIDHRIDLGRPSEAPHRLNSAALLKSADIVLASDLVMTLSGSFAGANISAEDISKSHLAKHLVEYLQMNATQLGLSYVSGVIYDQGDDRPKVIIRPICLRPLRLQHMPTCATLKSLDLAYTWQIPFQQAHVSFSPLTGPFSQTLALPHLTLLDNAVERFVKWHLVKRYPLIFGSWRRVASLFVDLLSGNDLKLQQLEIESSSSVSIYHSIRRIIDRSDNNNFKENCEDMLMTVKERLLVRTAKVAALLYDIVPGPGGLSSACLQTSMGDEEVLCLAMERLFQAGLPPSKFQVSRLRPILDQTEDEELSQTLAPCPNDDSEQRKDLWGPSSSPPLDPVDLVDTSSSFVHLPFGLNEHRGRLEGVEIRPSLTPEKDPLDWDDVLEDDISSSQAAGHNRVAGTINPLSGEGLSQGTGDSGTPSATFGTHRHMMDFGNDLLSFNMIHSNNANNKNGSSKKLICPLENDVQNSSLNHRQASAEDLFVQDGYYGIEIDLEDYYDAPSTNYDHSGGDCNELLLRSTLTSEHVPSSILSAPHLTYHVSSNTCSRTDHNETAAPGLSGAIIWNHGLEEFIELDTDWEEDEDFLNLIDE